MAQPRGPRAWLRLDRFGWALLWPAAFYLASALLMPTEAFWTPDAGAKFAQMLNVHWTGAGFDSAIAYPAQDVDPQQRLLNLPFGYNPSPDGQFRTFYPMAFAVLSRGAYALFGLRGLLLLPMLAGLVAALFAGLIVERWRPGRGWLAILLTAFATPVLFYSQIFWEHTISVALALAGVWAMQRATGEAIGQRPKARVGTDDEGKGQRRTTPAPGTLTLPSPATAGEGLWSWRILGWYALGLGLVALACLFRLEMLLFLVCCLGWCGYQLFRLGRWGQIAVAGAGVAGLAAIALVALTTGYAKTLGPGERDVADHALGYLFDPAARAQFPGDLWQRLFQVFYNVPDAGAVALRPMGYLTLAALALAIGALVWQRQQVPLLILAAAAIAAPAAVNVFYPSVVWSVHGLVLSCPLILAAIALLRGQQRGRWLIASSFVVFALAEMVFLNWSTAGGREWGSRSVLVIYPLAAMVVAANWPLERNTEHGTQNTEFPTPTTRAETRRQVERIALGLLVAMSAGTQARGLVQLRADLPVAVSWTQALQEMPPAIVATDVWWLTSTAAPAYYRHRFVLLPDGPNQASDAAYLASQPLAHSLPVVYAMLCVDHCQLPASLAGSFDLTSASEAKGLWLAHIRPRLAAS